MVYANGEERFILKIVLIQIRIHLQLSSSIRIDLHSFTSNLHPFVVYDITLHSFFGFLKGFDFGVVCVRSPVVPRALPIVWAQAWLHSCVHNRALVLIFLFKIFEGKTTRKFQQVPPKNRKKEKRMGFGQKVVDLGCNLQKRFKF